MDNADIGLQQMVEGLSNLKACTVAGATHFRHLEVLGQQTNSPIDRDRKVLIALGALAALSTLASLDPSLEGFRRFEVLDEWANSL